ncbi:MAG: hypothetical protein AAB504_00305 [Patescibacteria group bacterium]
MAVNYSPDLSGVERKIKDGIKQLKRLEWYQKWWGILILGVIASMIVAIIFYFL